MGEIKICATGIAPCGRSLRVTFGGAVLCRGERGDELICWLPEADAKLVRDMWKVYDFSVDRLGDLVAVPKG